MKRILVAVLLLLGTIAIYQQQAGITQLQVTMAYVQAQPNLSVLDSIGVITNGHRHGSCVAVDPNLILTAGHCIRDLRDAWIEIGGVKHEIKSKWRSSQYDMGFVVIDANLPYLKLGYVPELLQEVYMVGTPHNTIFVNTITKGVVCKLDIEDTSLDINWSGNFICDAMGWCGVSGGPVLSKYGYILGIYVGLNKNVDNFSVCEPVTHIREALVEYEKSCQKN